MADLSPLKELLVDKIQIDIAEKNGRRFARLKENDPSAKLKKVDIYDIPQGSILIKVDEYCTLPDTIFKDNEGQRKRCDYVLVSSINGNNLILFIELKSANIRKADVERQFKGAECIIDYCDAALNRFHNQSDLLKGHKKRFVIFYYIPLNKKPTRQKILKRNDAPENAYRYPNPQCPSLNSLVML